jgi:predicted ATPase
VTVTGEAGIGKTRLVDEFVARSTGLGLLLRAECPNTGPAQALPLAAFRAAFSDLVSDVESRAWEPSQLADFIARRLIERCRDAPVLILVEDLHWADQATLHLLDYLARALRPRPAMVLVTVRTDPPPPAVVADAVAEIERLPHAVRVEVGRLGPDDVVRQLHSIVGRPPAAALAERIISRSDGVPFLVEELAAVDRLAGVGEGAPLPERLQDLLMRRTRGLGSEATTVLHAAAAAAADVDDAALTAVTGLDLAVVRAQLRELVSSGLLTASGRGYRFRHSLLREAVEADLLPHEVAALHTGYGHLVDQRRAEGQVKDALPAQVAAAYHWWRAGDRASAFTAAVVAADSAHRIGAPAEELQLLRRALQLHGDEDEPDRPELCFRAADAAHRSGDPHAAYRLYEDARQSLGR